jgi:hypothetical protein
MRSPRIDTEHQAAVVRQEQHLKASLTAPKRRIEMTVQ